MQSLEALARIRAMDLPVFRTGDAAGALATSNATASKLLTRMADAGIVVRLVRGCWALAGSTDPLVVGSILVHPWPSYGSLQTALYLHGMIESIPRTTYLVSLVPTRRYETPMGAFSVHRIGPDFFFGWEELGRHGAKLACPEKALLDVLYLSPAKSRLFASLPELDLPRTFRRSVAREMVSRIRSARRRTLVARRLAEVIGLPRRSAKGA